MINEMLKFLYSNDYDAFEWENDNDFCELTLYSANKRADVGSEAGLMPNSINSYLVYSPTRTKLEKFENWLIANDVPSFFIKKPQRFYERYNVDDAKASLSG